MSTNAGALYCEKPTTQRSLFALWFSLHFPWPSRFRSLAWVDRTKVRLRKRWFGAQDNVPATQVNQELGGRSVTLYKHRVKLASEEFAILRSLKGDTVRGVLFDGWGVEVLFDEAMLRFDPFEVSAADAEHLYGEVVRPSLKPMQASAKGGDARRVAGPLGDVVGLDVLTVSCGFTPLVPVSAFQINGVEIPAGDEYALEFVKPSQTTNDRTRPWIELDVAVVLWTSSGRVAVFCGGIGYFLDVVVNEPIRADWAHPSLVRATAVIPFQKPGASRITEVGALLRGEVTQST